MSGVALGPSAPANATNATSCRPERRSDGLVRLELDVPSSTDNALNDGALRELSDVMRALRADRSVQAIVLTSSKRGKFCAGIDPAEWLQVRSLEALRELADVGHELCLAIAASEVPVVAAIDGSCTGAGLALALACHERVATRDRRTSFGAYEPGLAMVPLFGSCARLITVVGVASAIEVVRATRSIGVERARRLGLVDAVVTRGALLVEAEARARALAKRAREEGVRPGDREVAGGWIERTAVGRRLVIERARWSPAGSTTTARDDAARTKALDVLSAVVADGDHRAREVEREALAALASSTDVRATASVAVARRRVELERGLPDRPDVEGRRVERLGVLGATRAGSAVMAAAASVAKLQVRLWDRDDASIGRALADVRRRLDDRAVRRLSAREKSAAIARATATIEAHGMDRCDVIVECVFDDAASKRAAFSAIDALGRNEIVIATTSTSMGLDELGRLSGHPERVVGFRPAWALDRALVEIGVTDATAPWATATAVDLGRRLGWLPIVVRQDRGTYVGRLVAAYVDEAAHLLAEGARAEDVDDALRACGFAIGPIAMLDVVELDVATRAALTVQAGSVSPRPANDGLFSWLAPRKDAIAASTITQRCVLAIVNEAAEALGDGVLRDACDGDLAAVLGLGFPATLGGPFRWIDEAGAATVLDWLESLASRHGDRFAPAPLLVALAKSGRRLY